MHLVPSKRGGGEQTVEQNKKTIPATVYLANPRKPRWRSGTARGTIGSPTAHSDIGGDRQYDVSVAIASFWGCPLHLEGMAGRAIFKPNS